MSGVRKVKNIRGSMVKEDFYLQTNLVVGAGFSGAVIASLVTDNSKNTLNWIQTHGIQDSIKTAYNWEKFLNERYVNA